MGLPQFYLSGLTGIVMRSVLKDPARIVTTTTGSLQEFLVVVEQVALACSFKARNIAAAADELAAAAHRMAEAIAEPVQLEEQ